MRTRTALTIAADWLVHFWSLLADRVPLLAAQRSRTNFDSGLLAGHRFGRGRASSAAFSWSDLVLRREQWHTNSASALSCLLSVLAILVAHVTLSGTVLAQSPSAVTVFQNVRIFDGKAQQLTAPSNVLIRGNKIERISTQPIPTDRRADRTIIDCGGRTLMPGLIDAHWHVALASIPRHIAHFGDIGYLNLLASKEARATLLRGFTTIRDTGGASFAIKRAIDEGVIDGPRIYPSGAAISQTGGHGDSRPQYDIPKAPFAPLSQPEQIGQSVIADGPDEVLRRVREQFMQGASQIKLMAGGGVASDFDPLDVTQYTDAELRRPWRQPKTGAPMSPCTPTHRVPSEPRSTPASSASSTAT